MEVPLSGVIVEGVLRKCKRYKLFKTKWIEKYFILHCIDRENSLYAIDEHKTIKKKDIKKRYKLEYVNRVESNLSISDPSLACSTRADRLCWIFSVGFTNTNDDLYLVANNEEEMNVWVRNICCLCKLQRDEVFSDYPGDAESSQLASSLISGMSVSSNSLDNSLADNPTFHENTTNSLTDYYQGGMKLDETSYRNLDDDNEDRMAPFNFGGLTRKSLNQPKRSVTHHMSNQKQSTVIRKHSYSTPCSPSEESSSNIFSKSDGSPVNPESVDKLKSNYIRLQNCSSTIRNRPRFHYPSNGDAMESCSDSSSMYSSRKTVEDDSTSCTSGPPVPPPRKGRPNRVADSQNVASARQYSGDARNQRSSCETLKMDLPTAAYPESVTSSEGAAAPFIPPPIDRSNKPKNLRQEENRRIYLRYNDNYEQDNSHVFSRRMITDVNSRRNLNYFVPLLDNHLVSSNSTRSPTPSDVEYISVDVDRTLAFKQMRRTPID